MNLIESKTLELKREIKKPERFLQTVVAFSNTSGGDIWIGIDEKTKNIHELSNPKLEEERIANLISDSILPLIVPEIELVSNENKTLIKVTIYPGPSAPYYLKSKGEQNGVYIRVGSTNRIAGAEIIADLERKKTHKSFDEIINLNWRDDMIDVDALKKDLSASSLPLTKIDDTLMNFSLTEKSGNNKCLTNAGMILYGKNRAKFFPQAFIKIATFSGDNKAKLLEMTEFKQYPVEAIEAALHYLKEKTKVNFKFNEAKRKMKYLYPLEALREGVINAVVHADYSHHDGAIKISLFNNRLEIENSGLLNWGLTIEDILSGVSKVRNKVIARYFEKLGLIEQWGSGVQRILESCKEYNLTPPKFEELATHFRLTLFLTPLDSQEIEISDREKQIMSMLKKEAMSTGELAQVLNLSPRGMRTILALMMKKNLIKDTGKNLKDPNKKYLLNE
jgi:predicted HTH transcriptional regulator